MKLSELNSPKGRKIFASLRKASELRNEKKLKEESGLAEEISRVIEKHPIGGPRRVLSALR